MDGEILDLGCDQAFLREVVKGYVGLDIAGKLDLFANLEEGIPFQDKS